MKIPLRSIRVPITLALAVLAMHLVLPMTSFAQDQKAATTLDNLQAAFDGESNAHARYLLFAAKAEEEGFGKVASLFRAAARAEQIHASNHASVIKQLGATPTADIKTADVRSTKENLLAALAGESYERDTMYPEFLALARKENNKDALRTFNFAKSAEAEHAKLYQEALDNLESWKGDKMDFYVCAVCGNTVKSVGFEKCPVCFTSADKYEKVS